MLNKILNLRDYLYYRDRWQLERGFHRFKRCQLPALPIYMSNEEHIIGLMLLITINC